MSKVPCGMGKRGDGIDTSTFYTSIYARHRSKVKVWERSIWDWLPADSVSISREHAVVAPHPSAWMAGSEDTIVPALRISNRCRAQVPQGTPARVLLRPRLDFCQRPIDPLLTPIEDHGVATWG